VKTNCGKYLMEGTGQGAHPMDCGGERDVEVRSTAVMDEDRNGRLDGDDRAHNLSGARRGVDAVRQLHEHRCRTGSLDHP